LADAERTRCALRIHGSLELMRRGKAHRDAWHDLADSINMVDALTRMEKLDMAEAVRFAHVGMVQAMKSPDPDAMEMDADYLEAVTACVKAYDEAMGRFSARTMLAAAKLQRLLIQHGRAKDGVIVLYEREGETA